MMYEGGITTTAELMERGAEQTNRKRGGSVHRLE